MQCRRPLAACTGAAPVPSASASVAVAVAVGRGQVAAVRETAAATDAVQADKSARTAPGQRVDVLARQGFASPLRALDPWRHGGMRRTGPAAEGRKVGPDFFLLAAGPGPGTRGCFARAGMRAQAGAQNAPVLACSMPRQPAPMLARGAPWLRPHVRPTAFGNALGNGIVDSMQPTQGTGPWSDKNYTNEYDKQSDQAYEARRSQEWISQSDAIQRRRMDEASAPHREQQWIDQSDAIQRQRMATASADVAQENFRMLERQYRQATDTGAKRTPVGPAPGSVWTGGAGGGRGFVNPAPASMHGADFAGRSRITDPAAYADPMAAHKRYRGVSAGVGDAYGMAQPVLDDWRSGRPVNPTQLRSAFDSLAAQGAAAQARWNAGLDSRAPLEVVGINSRLNWLSMAAGRNGIELTPEQNMLAFGASMSLPIGENDYLSAGMRMPPGAVQRTRYAISNSWADESKRFVNLFPEDIPQVASVIPNDKLLTMSQNKLAYVVKTDGTLVVGRNNQYQGHIDLAGGEPVLAAGELAVHAGQIRKIGNYSGHYRPSGPEAQRAAEEAFRRAGFDVEGKYKERKFN